MSDEHDDPRPYDPEELDDDVNGVGADGANEDAHDLKAKEDRIENLEDDVDTDDPTGEGELLRGMPRGLPQDSAADIDEKPAPTHPAEPAP